MSCDTMNKLITINLLLLLVTECGSSSYTFERTMGMGKKRIRVGVGGNDEGCYILGKLATHLSTEVENRMAI